MVARLFSERLNLIRELVGLPVSCALQVSGYYTHSFLSFVANCFDFRFSLGLRRLGGHNFEHNKLYWA